MQSAHGNTKVSISHAIAKISVAKQVRCSNKQVRPKKKLSNGTETLCETSHSCILFETTCWVLKTGVNLADHKIVAQKLQ